MGGVLSCVKALGFELQIMDARQWRDEHLARVAEDNALFPFKELYEATGRPRAERAAAESGE